MASHLRRSYTRAHGAATLRRGGKIAARGGKIAAKKNPVQSGTHRGFSRSRGNPAAASRLQCCVGGARWRTGDHRAASRVGTRAAQARPLERAERPRLAARGVRHTGRCGLRLLGEAQQRHPRAHGPFHGPRVINTHGPPEPVITYQTRAPYLGDIILGAPVP